MHDEMSANLEEIQRLKAEVSSLKLSLDARTSEANEAVEKAAAQSEELNALR